MTWPARPVGDSLLQEGIYLERSVPPPPAWRILLLNILPNAPADHVAETLRNITRVLRGLQAGIWQEITPAEIPSNTFAFLLGYGASFFDTTVHNPPVTLAPRPDHLTALSRERDQFPSLPWSSTPTNRGGADLLLQFTGLSDHAVCRAAVEVANVIADRDFPLQVAATFDGFGRDDGRSWLGFHDGVSNLEPSERLSAVECAGDPAWNRGGTFLAFLRLEIDLAQWRRLSRRQQELIVGRDKRSGWPVELADAQAGTRAGQDQPWVEHSEEWRARDAYFNPPDTADTVLHSSHIHRVNQHRGSGTTLAANRIFRQGYEYLEDLGPAGMRLGLNFISFQSDLRRLQQILGLQGWLGDANFGGGASGGPPAIVLARLQAGGYYAIPPREMPFPGASLIVAPDG